jgi:MFS family permease
MAAPVEADRPTFREVSAVGEYRAMWLAQFLSLMGDQLARVALTVLVFDRTHSAALTGLTYALTFVPTVVGALTLSSVADRGPRRSVVLALDAVRALVVAAMVIPGLPLAWLCILVAVMSFLGGPYKAAQLAVLRDVLGAQGYPAGTAPCPITNDVANLVGFGLGGILSTAISTQVSLGLDAATFAASALLVGCFVRSRPVPEPTGDDRFIITGAKVVWNEPRRRAIFLTTALGLFYIAPAGLVAPYVAELGHGSAMVGVVLASGAVGGIVGLPLLARFVPAGRRPVAYPLACLTPGLPLILVLAVHDIYVAMVLFAVSSAMWAIQVVMSASFLAGLLPDSNRAQGMAIAGSMNLTVLGLGTALAGLIGQATSPTLAIALAGTASVVVAIWPSALWIRSTRRSPLGQLHGHRDVTQPPMSNSEQP